MRSKQDDPMRPERDLSMRSKQEYPVRFEREHALKEETTPINNRIFYRKMMTLSLPIIVQSLMLALVAAGDALMLGRVGQNEMAAVSLATQVQFVQNMFLSAIVAAGSILGAQYFGKGDRHTMRELLHLMLRFCGAVSILFFGLLSCIIFNPSHAR